MENLKGVLSDTYQRRHSLNARYSKNAFARDLGISPTALSQFLSGKRMFSNRNVLRIEQALCLPRGFVAQGNSDETESRIQLDTFSLIAEWYHFAILNLVEVEPIKGWSQITKRLGIDKNSATTAVARLISLGFLKREGGRLRRVQKSLDTGTDIPSEALRKHNREKMELAIEALEKIQLSERDVSSLTLTFDPRTMPKIKSEIAKFKRRVSKVCRSGNVSEVYALNIQFFPISKKETQK